MSKQDFLISSTHTGLNCVKKTRREISRNTSKLSEPDFNLSGSCKDMQRSGFFYLNNISNSHGSPATRYVKQSYETEHQPKSLSVGKVKTYFIKRISKLFHIGAGRRWLEKRTCNDAFSKNEVDFISIYWLSKKNYNKSVTFNITFITILPYHVSIHHVNILKRKLFSTDSNVRCFCSYFHGSL